MSTHWSHLANADLIDWVIESLRLDSEKWDAARSAARATTLDAAWNATLAAAWNAAWNAARYAARAAALDAAWDASRGASRGAAWDAILALVAYDDCDQYLSMSYEQLLAWALLSERSQAVLLLPMKWVQEHECLVTST